MEKDPAKGSEAEPKEAPEGTARPEEQAPEETPEERLGKVVWSGTIWGNPASKKNSESIARTRDGRPFLVQSPTYKRFEKSALEQLALQRKGLTEPIAFPVNVRCLYYMDTHRRVDRHNLEQATEDVLVRAGILSDDNRDISAGADGTRVYFDRENPRTEIEIRELLGYAQWKPPGAAGAVVKPVRGGRKKSLDTAREAARASASAVKRPKRGEVIRIRTAGTGTGTGAGESRNWRDGLGLDKKED